MSSVKRHRKWLVVIALVAAVGAFFVLRRGAVVSPPPPGPAVPSVVDVEIGEYYDWNSYDGPLRKDVTSLLAEPLFERSERGYDVSRLASDARFENGRATVKLRESAHWSDGTPLAASHVVDAYDRAKVTGMTATLPAVTLKAVGTSELVVEGLKDRDEMSALLQSRALVPVRTDLIAAQGKDAFKVTIGPYVPTQIVRTLKSDASLVLEPNPYYYRGAKNAPLSLGVAALVASQKGGG